MMRVRHRAGFFENRNDPSYVGLFLANGERKCNTGTIVFVACRLGRLCFKRA